MPGVWGGGRVERLGCWVLGCWGSGDRFGAFACVWACMFGRVSVGSLWRFGIWSGLRFGVAVAAFAASVAFIVCFLFWAIWGFGCLELWVCWVLTLGSGRVGCCFWGVGRVGFGFRGLTFSSQMLETSHRRGSVP